MPAKRRRKGEGAVIHDRTAGRWVARVDLGIRTVVVDGAPVRRRVRKRVVCRTEREAKAALEGLRRDYTSAETPTMGTLDEYLAEWLRGRRPSIRESTYVSYSGHVRMHISPLLGGIPAVRLRPQDVRRLVVDRLAAGKSPTTVRRILTTLHMALEQGVKDGVLARNAVDGVRAPKVERRDIRAMTPTHAKAILVAVADDPLGPLYILLLGTGMRLGEACALDWRDIDLERGTVYVRTGKTAAATRTIPLPGFVLVAMKVQRLRSPGAADAAVFRGLRGRAKSRGLRPSTVSHAFPLMLERKKLPPMRVHDLRHATATLLMARGVPMRSIADLLGHASPAITANVYAHVSEELRRQAAGEMEEALGGRG